VKQGNPKHLLECWNAIFVLPGNMLLQLDLWSATSAPRGNMLRQLDWQNVTSVLSENMLLQLDNWIVLCVKRANPKNLLECCNAIFVLPENMLPQQDRRPAHSANWENSKHRLGRSCVKCVKPESTKISTNKRVVRCVRLESTGNQAAPTPYCYALIVARTSCQKKARRVAIRAWICTSQDPDLGRVYCAALGSFGTRKRLRVCNAVQIPTKSSKALQGAQGV